MSKRTLFDMRSLLLLATLLASVSGLSRECNAKVSAFMSCSKPHFPKPPDMRGYDRAVSICFRRSRCKSPKCLQNAIMNILPESGRSCLGLEDDSFIKRDLATVYEKFWAKPREQKHLIKAICEEPKGSKPKTLRTIACLEKVDAQFRFTASQPDYTPFLRCGLESRVTDCRAEVSEATCRCARQRKQRKKTLKRIREKCEIRVNLRRTFEVIEFLSCPQPGNQSRF